jgi:large subunit ribosomal protein L18
MMNKFKSRTRRGMKTKAVLRYSTRPRLVVHRSGAHIYSQIVIRAEGGDKVVVSASTMDKEIKPNLKGTKIEQAQLVGKSLGERAKANGLVQVSFDRAGYKYHGRVKALADGAREAGLDF